MSFKTIYTTSGITSLAEAIATGTPVILTHMAVGDGNGNPVTPSESQTELVREMYRASVNRVYQNPDDPIRFTAELIVPASVGGFTMREVGIFDADGNLFAVGNLPDTYKPTDSEGAFSDAVVRLEFIAANGAVTLVVDPNVAVATHTWVINNVTAATIIPGGTTGQVLAKDSNADGDYIWKDPTDANVIVDMIEETQTLAAAQTVVTLVDTTTNGLAIYIEGIRLRGDQWTPTDPTHVTLASSYPAGTKFVAVQNEPAGTVVFPLAQNLNLSDVPDKALARTNMDVYSKSEADASGQPGDIKYTARSTAPSGWLKANGAPVSRTAYAALFAAIGTTFGAGDGFNTFNLPDLRGEFLRGWDDGRGVDSGRAFGSAQADMLKSHNHAVGPYDGVDGATIGQPRPYISEPYEEDPRRSSTFTGFTGGAETRPRNIAMLACIKY